MPHLSSEWSAAVVCDPCRRRKKSCNKGLPKCDRCLRFKVKCTYSRAETQPKGTSAVEVPLDPTTGALSPPSHPFSIDEQVFFRAGSLLNAIERKRGNTQEIWVSYFATFNKVLPIIDRKHFYWLLEHTSSTLNSHSSVLLLAIYLVTQLLKENNGADSEQLYPTLKSIYMLLHSTGQISIELIQAGVLIANFEHTQALHQDAWLQVGQCARMAQILGLHKTVRHTYPKEEEHWTAFENRRCLWWSIVVLERIVNAEYEPNNLPFASEAPRLGDFLPLPGQAAHRVEEGLLLPKGMQVQDWSLSEREFGQFSHFATTIQAIYMSTLIAQHITNNEQRESSVRHREAAYLDTCLQSFVGFCIPPPGKSTGQYCGAYSLTVLATVSLYEYELECARQDGDTEGVARYTRSLSFLASMMVAATKTVETGVPLDFDTLSFWCHRIVYIGAMMHIKYAERNTDWKSDLQVCKDYMGRFVPRYKNYHNNLREIEEAEAAACSI